MMIGLPGDDKKTVLRTGRKIAALTPAFVRIYPTIVLAGSPLGRLYAKGQYYPLDLAVAVDLTQRFPQREHNIAVTAFLNTCPVFAENVCLKE